ncbi:MAG: ATP-dependent Clp protease ATP-binding subunit [Planctomycetes bacterium]|nr:ATP-dependent Clp protease ATP-binding subunit [Planctomycetota bacterium]MBI3844145.1 ATP-dependent Clp protease ATP-binding subunit [Planctomycetota bacterium]
MSYPKLSPAAEKVLAAASEESEKLEHHFLGVEHLFLGLAREAEDGFSEAFRSQGVDLPRVTETLRQNLESVPHPSIGDQLVVTPRCNRVLQLAGRVAARAGSQQVEPSHILDAILREGRSVPVRLMHSAGIDVAELQDALTVESKPTRSSTPLLSRYGRDLTALARTGGLSTLIGREKEMDLIAQVLLRKNKNNPVLVGEAGVGKTAVVEGFAQRLLSANCPEPLRNRRVIELSVGTLVAGTKYRGEFEQRLLDIAEEAARHPEIVLFLDEIHTLVGAGASSGESLDASNIFKPALARGELRCIGATTIEEYRRHIEKDPALERRFEKILVEEPSVAETLEILDGVRPSLEEHHQVTITADALRAAVDLTMQHVPDRRLPDKAMDAIDQSCARKRLQSYRQASKGRGAGTTARGEVVRDDIVRTVAQWTGVPLERLTAEAARQILGLEDELRARVVGQDHAVRAVARAIQTAKAGLAPANRPVGVFLFLGPTGVGKTQLAKSVASVLFGDERRLVRFDMSEFTEPHSVAKLIGAPPGYVGHEQEGLLIAALRTHPHSVVLFDEVEKAHPQVFDLFLQIFDEGRLSGAHGKSADFTQAVVILTSNVDVQVQRRASMGFHAEEQSVSLAEIDPRAALVQHFRPELINRFDQVVVFHRLERDSLRRIIDQHICEVEGLLEPRHLHLVLDDAVYDHLLKLGESDQYGARELRRVFDRVIRQPLAQEVLSRGEDLGTIRATLSPTGVTFST